MISYSSAPASLILDPPVPQPKFLVYIMDVPSLDKSDSELTSMIGQRIEATFRLTLIDIGCYSKLGIGFIRVKDNETKLYLTETIRTLALSPRDASATILFTETLEYISYVVLDTTNVKEDIDWPKPEVISQRWIEVYSKEKPSSCEQVNIQFPNIYRIVSSSFEQLCEIMNNQDFGIHNSLCARVYLGADCSYLENLSRSTTEDEIRQAITNAIGQTALVSKLDLFIQLNKQTNNACIIAANVARKMSTKTIYIGSQPIAATENLPLCLLVLSDPKIYNDDLIIQHKTFDGKARKLKRLENKLILEILDKKIFNECVKRKVLRIGENSLSLEIYTPFSDPGDREVDAYTWYKGEMLRCKADIMQFVPNPQHEIFHFRWNSKIWLDEFLLVKYNNQNAKNNGDTEQREKLTNDQIRHRLRITVMLNTIAAIRKKSYMIGDKEIKLNLNPSIKTIIYNHQSKLKEGGTIPLKKTPYDSTKVEVVNEDCLVIYGNLMKQRKKPLLLNMASATSPGGGYRKGDGAQEENVFRRSDYLRSLDTALDEYIDDPSERSHCTSICDLDSCFDARRMYPMDEYGAIYTTGLTVFRRTEDEGYAYMEEPLTSVCSLAMAAYRDPKLDGNMLAPKFAVGMRKKIENFFSIGYHHTHDCLVLSALGCGAFRNPPEHVAKIFRSVIEQYAGFFELVIFAIIDDHNTGQTLNRQGNFKPFYDELNGKIMKPFSPINQANTIFGPYRLLSDGATVHDISIRDAPPCNFGAKCSQMYDSKHAPEFSHPPLCIEQSLNGKCTKTANIVHMSSFIHREPCRHGAQCRDIDDKKHAEEYEHPSFCPSGGGCQDTSDSHEREYRHLPLCKFAHKCVDFKKHIESHCKSVRHYMPPCRHGQYCVEFHNKEHMNNYKHPFPTPCPWTPYNCPYHNELTQSSDAGKASQLAHQHCLEYGHVCPFGRSCTDTNSWHWEKWIHVPRMPCQFGVKCNKLNQEDHLNSFTHPNIRDIRIACKNADKCHDRQDPNHLSRYRHSMTFKESGVVRYFNLNKNLDFVQNQNDNIKRIFDYAKSKNWRKFTLESIPTEIIDWIRTVQPVHRCKLEIFESIILHGHVMSLEYMDNLSKPKFVANSVLQHSQMRRIERLRIPECADHAREYITALVTDIFEKAGFLKKIYAGGAIDTLGTHANDAARLADLAELIKRKEGILSTQINNLKDMEIIRAKTRQIAEASMKLNLNKAGIGYHNDIKVGTNKTIFSILGPHAGHYYGDVVLIFKREILHHPDVNYTLQAATSYVSGNCYDWRPWLDTNPKSEGAQIDLFHKTKLHPSIPGYEYATALELIAITSHILDKKLTEINLDKVMERWCKVDSHETIEAHLPSLIPLDYIEHIYMPRSIYKALNENTRKVVDDLFKNCITLSDKESKDYTKFILNKLNERFRQGDPHSVSRPIRGAVITIPSTNFNDHYILPLTISQAIEQHRKNHPTMPNDSTIYIYWQLMNGDMMLTLSSEPIDAAESYEKKPCLICYVAPKPTFGKSNDVAYHEQTSYLNSGQPFEHSIFIAERRFAQKSNEFYMGCNTDDVMTLCLEIQRSTGTVTLSHAGSNSIYNHEKISCKFSKTQLNINKLEFIHVSAGSLTVPIRNLIITFQKQENLHPTFDINFKKNDSSAATAAPTGARANDNPGKDHAQSCVPDDDQPPESPGLFARIINKAGEIKDKVFGSGDDSSLKPCSKSINCVIQFSDNASTHNSQFSHPCRFAELCRNPEANLTHPPDSPGHPKCSFDKTCKELCDPIHRAQYCHTGLPFFLIPCRRQKDCNDNSEGHRKKYSHGEEGLDTIAKAASKGKREYFL
jgi:uncharacterized protein (TIGR02452 family)